MYLWHFDVGDWDKQSSRINFKLIWCAILPVCINFGTCSFLRCDLIINLQLVFISGCCNCDCVYWLRSGCIIVSVCRNVLSSVSLPSPYIWQCDILTDKDKSCWWITSVVYWLWWWLIMVQLGCCCAVSHCHRAQDKTHRASIIGKIYNSLE